MNVAVDQEVGEPDGGDRAIGYRGQGGMVGEQILDEEVVTVEQSHDLGCRPLAVRIGHQTFGVASLAEKGGVTADPCVGLEEQLSVRRGDEAL